MSNEIATIYAKFNLFSLSFNLLSFILVYFLNCFEYFPSTLFYVSATLKLTLIVLSCIHYYIRMTMQEKIKRSKYHKIYIIFLEKIYDSIPIFEMLIEMNIELSLNAKKHDILAACLLKPSYFFCRLMVNELRHKKNLGFFINFSHILGVLIITLNIWYVFPLDDSKFLAIFITECAMILGCFFWFSQILKCSLPFEFKVLRSYLSDLGESVAIFEEITIKNTPQEKKFKIFYVNEPSLVPEKQTKTLKKLSFADLNTRIPLMQVIDSDYSMKSELMSTIQPFRNSLPQTFSNLKDVFEFYNSLKNNHLTVKFVEIQNEWGEEEEKKSSLKLMVKKHSFWKRSYFFVKFLKNQRVKNREDHQTRLLNSISHELKTPLNGTLTLLELMRNQISEENSSETEIYLDGSLACLKLMENTLNNMIDYSLILSGQFIICMSDVNIYSLMKEVFHITKNQVQLKNIDYSIELDAIFSKMEIYTDYARLKQIILNITLNSIQFTNKGTIKIEIHLTSRKRPTKVEFKISDTGMGMDPIFCRNLMDKLNNDEDSHFQANSTGSCMGLTISQKLALLLGTEGLIIKSNLNEGTTVSFTIFDQNSDDGLSIIKHSSQKHIVIKESNQIVPHFAAIIDHSKKIDCLRQRNKTLRRREISNESFEEGGANSEGLTNKRINDENNTANFTLNLKIHNFDSIVRPQIWYNPKLDYQTTKTTSNKEHTIKEVKESGFYSAGFRKTDHSLSRKKSVGNQVFNFQNFQEKEDLSQFSQPLYLGSKSNTTENLKEKSKSSIPKGNIECQCEEVLIVDDDAFNLLSLELILKNFNVKCVKAMNGKDAVDLVANKSCSSLKCRGFKIVFMDYQMPIMDGVESTKEILKMYGVIEEEGRHINIIGCTAFTTKKEVENFLKAGLRDIIFKPLNKEIVGNILNEWLEGG